MKNIGTMFTLFRHETFFLMVQDGSLLEAFIATLIVIFYFKRVFKSKEY